ncbi:hypothetical protein QYF36_007417 [Acer negundo]|nr:hypothetical protein QYF36_007417 [Acer negundo]
MIRSLRLPGTTLSFQVETEEETCQNEGIKITEVDSVKRKETHFKGIEESQLDRMFTNVDEEGYLYGVSGSSGGYAETVFLYASETLFGRVIEGQLSLKNHKEF